MTRHLANFRVLAAVGLVVSGCSTARPPVRADYRLVAPQSQAERAYLGLPSQAATFQLEDIQCEVLVIDCFDMYCHLCQVGAKHVNELYQLAQNRGLGARVKFIGLGAGDTPLEVSTYKQKLKVPFPVFPDRRTLIVRRFGELRLPNLIVLRNRGGRLEVVHRSPGPLLSATELLSRIQADLGQATSHYWSDPLQVAQPTCPGPSGVCTNSALHGQERTLF